MGVTFDKKFLEYYINLGKFFAIAKIASILEIKLKAPNPIKNSFSQNEFEQRNDIYSILAPIKVIRAAIVAVPAVKYALGLVGIAAAATLVGQFVGTGISAALTMGFLLIGMIVLYLFSFLTTKGDTKGVALPAKVLLWIVTVCVSAFVVAVTTAIIFGEPKNFAILLNVNKSTFDAIQNTDNILGKRGEISITGSATEKFGYIYLGRRNENKWVSDKYAYGRIIDSDDIPKNGDIRTIVQGVHLRESVPDRNTPLVMKADLGTLAPGTRVRIKTITKIDPDGYYWASVDIQ